MFPRTHNIHNQVPTTKKKKILLSCSRVLTLYQTLWTEPSKTSNWLKAQDYHVGLGGDPAPNMTRYGSGQATRGCSPYWCWVSHSTLIAYQARTSFFPSNSQSQLQELHSSSQTLGLSIHPLADSPCSSMLPAIHPSKLLASNIINQRENFLSPPKPPVLLPSPRLGQSPIAYYCNYKESLFRHLQVWSGMHSV